MEAITHHKKHAVLHRDYFYGGVQRRERASSVFAKHGDVTVKFAFDLLDIKCHDFIILLKQTFLRNVIISI